ncbi:3'-5' exonuclease domain-containing protein 2 [Belliella kenyensis]|uniref:3'-5' exonuclease domain-containing protein 2 n=1 Tax=Belliella kenyensis TaxID=1472724 RepID=A0ABV8EM21_9BACT|nr:3'-5' exonuclease domain-containing protein 2 [Belliella kenyensis]MCH7400634.1 3'-5' exonuclease domain-containing protein 2 [Belliella kenyensis]MDN3602079.1 3'-5' exonuclease domain-containing protein 2 [Belliella kenyensis]
MIQKSITKEEVNGLPLGQFEGDIVLVDSLELVEEAVEDLYCQEFIGFDTETKPAFKKGVHHHVALLQLATPDVAYLFRLNEIQLPRSVQDIMEDANILKVGAAVLDDLRALKKLSPSFKPAGFFDLNDELKKVGFENIGVRNLAAMVLQFRVSKSEQVSNWEALDLSEKQRLYAATDAWVCLEIYKKLQFGGYLDDLFNR